MIIGVPGPDGETVIAPFEDAVGDQPVAGEGQVSDYVAVGFGEHVGEAEGVVEEGEGDVVQGRECYVGLGVWGAPEDCVGGGAGRVSG